MKLGWRCRREAHVVRLPRVTPCAHPSSSIVDMSAPGPTQSLGAPGPRAWWRGLSPRARTMLKRALAAAGAIVVLGSVVLARFLSVEHAERDAALALLRPDERGDVSAMLHKIGGC